LIISICVYYLGNSSQILYIHWIFSYCILWTDDISETAANAPKAKTFVFFEQGYGFDFKSSNSI